MYTHTARTRTHPPVSKLTKATQDAGRPLKVLPGPPSNVQQQSWNWMLWSSNQVSRLNLGQMRHREAKQPA